MKRTRETLKKCRDWFFVQKYRFDTGMAFLVFVNFALLVLAASDKLKTILGLARISQLVLLLIPAAFIGVWGFGYFLDAVVRAPTAAEKESGKRSWLWQKNFDEHEKIGKELAEIKKELKKIPRR